MAEYIERDALCYQLEKQATIDGQPRAIKRAIKIVANFPAADVVERKPLPEDVEELVKDLYAFSKECTDSDMCRDCQLCFMCEDGWPPNAIAHLIETWSATHKAMAKRKTGKWMPIIEANEYGETYQAGCYCSECDEVLQYEPNFCPNCGADCRGDRGGK